MTSQATANHDRYARQIVFGPIGREGQERIGRSRVTLIGCGALGSYLAEMLTRGGVGFLRIVDRDFVEISNLQRQTLFDEQDVAENLPKSEAAVRKLRKINSHIELEAIVADATHENIEFFIEGANLILEGTDNLQTRFLINDAAVKRAIPWIYGACLAGRGMGMVIPAGGKPCFRCLMDAPPEPGELETCESAGIIAPAVATIASFVVTEALKLLTGNLEAVNRDFFYFDLWTSQHRQMSLNNLAEGCPCCRDYNFEFLAGRGSMSTISLCGQKSVQVRPRNHGIHIDLPQLATRLGTAGQVSVNEFLLRLHLPELELTVFPDGRAIINGTSNIDEARSLYARYVGH